MLMLLSRKPALVNHSPGMPHPTAQEDTAPYLESGRGRPRKATQVRTGDHGLTAVGQ